MRLFIAISSAEDLIRGTKRSNSRSCDPTPNWLFRCLVISSFRGLDPPILSTINGPEDRRSVKIGTYNPSVRHGPAGLISAGRGSVNHNIRMAILVHATQGQRFRRLLRWTKSRQPTRKASPAITVIEVLEALQANWPLAATLLIFRICPGGVRFTDPPAVNVMLGGCAPNAGGIAAGGAGRGTGGVSRKFLSGSGRPPLPTAGACLVTCTALPVPSLITWWLSPIAPSETNSSGWSKGACSKRTRSSVNAFRNATSAAFS